MTTPSFIKEIDKRIFYVVPNSTDFEPNDNILEGLKRTNVLTILTTPYVFFEDRNVDSLLKKYHNNISAYLRNGNSPAIVIEEDNLEKTIVETLQGNTKQPRLFIQGKTFEYPGETHGYYQDYNYVFELIKLMSPSRIRIGGAYQSLNEKEYQEINANEDWIHETLDSFVDVLAITLRDTYLSDVYENITLKERSLNFAKKRRNLIDREEEAKIEKRASEMTSRVKEIFSVKED